MKKLIPLFIVAAGAVAYTLLKNKKDDPEETEEIKYVELDSDSGDSEDKSEDLEETDSLSSNIEEDTTDEDVREGEDIRPSFFHESMVPAEEELKERINSSEAVLEENIEEEHNLETKEDTFSYVDEYTLSEPNVEDEQHNKQDEVTEDFAHQIEHERNEEIEYIQFDRREHNEEVPTHEEETLKKSDEHTVGLNNHEPKVEDIEESYRASVDPIIRGVLGDDAIEVDEIKPIYESEEVDDIIANIAQQVGEDSYVQKESKILSPDDDNLAIYSDEVTEFSIQYPYLSKRFIKETLEFSEQFNAEYPIFSNVSIEHIVEFESADDLITFVQLIKTMNYRVSEGEEKHTVVVDREMMVENESILNDVFVVANQAYCFNGDYMKFRITHI